MLNLKNRLTYYIALGFGVLLFALVLGAIGDIVASAPMAVGFLAFVAFCMYIANEMRKDKD